ncbi:MAG: outer membrane beta-barrel protein [Bacteroidaceae bacterium]|nr:outer membrane beta-barrel protein [Bacteroidaceae bacterium]
MKKRYLGIVLALLIGTFTSFAQNKSITVSGFVIEKNTQRPVELAAVQLLSFPDSLQVAGSTTHENGLFHLQKVSAGKYLFKVSFLGYRTKYIPLVLTNAKPQVNIGNVLLSDDAILLKEAVITAQAPQVQVVEDTVVFNSSALRTPNGAMLEELVKKLPGARIDDSGTLTINGKEVKKIMLNGKEFFGGDVKTGMQNLPANMIEKLKTYDKKSDLSRITGIDDGNEETVLDLQVKKGMNQGWFGNLDLGAGSKSRYSNRLMMNRFDSGSQFSLIGGANNVNNQEFSGGGGGGPRFGQSNGLTANKMVGVNFATQNSKLETGGSVRFNYSDADIYSVNSSERFLDSGNSYFNSNNKNRNKNTGLNADFRMEWKPDTLTNIIFRPNISYSKSNNLTNSLSGTFNDDPLTLVESPNDYLDFDNLANIVDSLNPIRVNGIKKLSLSKGNSFSTDVSLQLNRKLNNRGRNITFRGEFGYDKDENNQYSQSVTRYYQTTNAPADSIWQYYSRPAMSHSYAGQLTYSEPLAKAAFLQFNYKLTYTYNTSDKSTYDLLDYPDWRVSSKLPNGYQSNLVDSLSKDAKYESFNHNMALGLLFVQKKYRLSLGLSFQPQNTKMSYVKDDYQIDTTRTVFNIAPDIDFRVRFSKVSQLRLRYRGKSSQPDMESLLPITDNSNPLSISKGNPGLKPSFTHYIYGFYNTYNDKYQRSIMAHFRAMVTQNSIVNSTAYNNETGGVVTQPQNINGNWSLFGMFGFNTALKNKKFTVNTFTRTNYTNQVAFLYDSTTKSDKKNTSTDLTLSENLSGTYRNNWFEFSLNGSIDYSSERNKLRPANDQKPYTYAYGASTNIYLPWSMSLATNITNNSRRGYSDSSMNKNELVWNAQLAQSFLKGSLTLSFEMNDILHQQSNISRALTASLRSTSEYNSINNYCMFHLIYKLNIFGSKDARQQMRGPGPRGLGGPGGRRFGGSHNHHRPF